MKYTILEQLDNIIYHLNESGNDKLLDKNVLIERLKEILNLFVTLKDKIKEQYGDINEEKINEFITNLNGNSKSSVNSSKISLSTEIKVNFLELFNNYLSSYYKNEKPADNKPKSTDNATHSDATQSSNSSIEENLIKKYSVDNEKNILSENNTALTDDIINKLKTIKWQKIKDNVGSIKTQIDGL